MKILILDDDLGFLFWIAKALEPFGYTVVPADTVSQANRLIRRLKLSVNMLMVNPELEGAVEFAEELRRRKRTNLKVVVLVSPEASHRGTPGIQADATHAKPDPAAIADLMSAEPDVTGPTLQMEWVKFVQQVLGHRTARSRAN